MKNKQKIKDDFKKKKRTHLLNGKEKQLAQEQIRRIVERTKTIKDPIKFEQALFKKYLAGTLNYDKDLQLIKETLDRTEIENILKEFDTTKKAQEREEKIQERKKRIEKFKEGLEESEYIKLSLF